VPSSWTSAPLWVDARTLAATMTVGAAAQHLGEALAAGLDPEGDGQRTRLAAPAGELLLMPSAVGGAVGVKVLTVRSSSQEHAQPVIQGVYALFDGESLQPTALLDGAALTELRTPATSVVALRSLAPPAVNRVALLGTGLQARAHARACADLFPGARLEVLGRRPERVDALVLELVERGADARPGQVEALPAADVVVCATGAATPLFAGHLVADHACVVAIGSHHPDRREVDSALMARSTVVVESRTSALREAGDVVIPVDEGVLDPDDLVPLSSLLTGGAAPDLGRPRLFKGTGMPWQDLVVARAVVDELTARSPDEEVPRPPVPSHPRA